MEATLAHGELQETLNMTSTLTGVGPQLSLCRMRGAEDEDMQLEEYTL